MIKSIFLPERIGSYQLFPKRIVGFDIGRSSVHATIVVAQGYHHTIESFVEEAIEIDPATPYEDRVAKALRAIAPKLGKYDAVYTALSSSLVIFKELSLPFLGLSKIKMVIPFEVESMLPFSLDTAVIDAIITKENKEESRTDLLVAAVKKEYIEQHLKMFEDAGYVVDKITVDMFELYGLYKSILHQPTSGLLSLIDIGAHTTRLAIIIDGQLKYIRSLNKGILTAAKKLQDITHLDSQENAEHFMRFGLEASDNPQYAKAAQDVTKELGNELHFTIDSFTNKLRGSNAISKIVLTGLGSEVPGITNSLKDVFKSDVEILHAKKIIHNGLVKSKLTTIPNSFLVSLATALSSPITQDFNLQKIHTNAKQDALLTNQIITALALAGLMVTAFILYGVLKTRKLKNAYNSSQTEAIRKLKDSFPDIRAKSLQSAKSDAEGKLKASQGKWAPLFYKNRSSFLKYLYELSRQINKKETGLDISSIEMDQNEIRISGSVRNIEAVRKLEEELKSELYTLEDPLQVADFKTRPIRLKINKNI